LTKLYDIGLLRFAMDIDKEEELDREFIRVEEFNCSLIEEE
jgi:hypothetical protein